MNEILKQNKTAFYVFDVKTLKDRVAYLRKMARNATEKYEVSVSRLPAISNDGRSILFLLLESFNHTPHCLY